MEREPISEKGATYDVVMRLMEDYKDQGYVVYLDNYYSSPVLFNDLFRNGISACGTVRVNRKGLPKRELQETKLGRGAHVAFRKGDLMALKWKDKKDVFMLSTKHNNDYAETGKDDQVSGEPIKKPAVVLEYNKYMGGVDRSDQMMQYHSFERKMTRY